MRILGRHGITIITIAAVAAAVFSAHLTMLGRAVAMPCLSVHLSLSDACTLTQHIIVCKYNITDDLERRSCPYFALFHRMQWRPKISFSRRCHKLATRSRVCTKQ